ncbi:MAG: nickel-dependent hydrogenase large subunit [Anaerolineales bacterium]|nr:nickel-dependent hydrogenase large subunit [Anaerolineales bacterium]MBS3753297.1 nickel-dependent hydrogenase large subunit [Anaerolineales bacterium]
MDKMNIPIGPQHPLLKEPLRLNIEISGERVLGGILRLGYVHRGIEKLAQTRNYNQNVSLTERVCGICSHVHTTTFCRAVEALLGLELPERVHYIRALMCEMERIHSHLLWLGILAKHIGLEMVFMHTWHDRESILDVMEEMSGGRVAHAVNQIGGVRFDLDEDHGPMVDSTVKKLKVDYEELLDVIEHDTTLKARTQGVAPLSTDDMKRYCVVGPVARASGVDVDMRRDDPMPPYDKLDFQVITHPDGDAWSRTYVRLQEIRQSLHLCKQIIDDIPEGPISVRAPRKVPAGEVVMRSEAPRGELFYYLRSDGSDYPARLKIRTPTLPALGILPEQLSEIHIADIPVVLAGIDLCIACADR